ncbi:hypothetical protein ACOSP7_012324 [Xanthoceras sorbifolium]
MSNLKFSSMIFVFLTKTSPETALTSPTSIFSSLLLPPTPTAAAMDSPTPLQGKTPTGSTASFNAAATSRPPPAKIASLLLPEK